MKIVKACANANIALVKYWGKSDAYLNIPAMPSLSMTLDGFYTTVSLSPSPYAKHTLIRDGVPDVGAALARLQAFLELVRQHYNYEGYFQIETISNIPFSAGLASSASFFAACAKALNHYLELCLSPSELSCLARLGSASAARSIFGDYVGLLGGKLKHREAHAFSLESKLKLVLTLATVEEGIKPFSSREAMNITASTSPFFKALVETSTEDFSLAREALSEGRFESLGLIMEHSTLKMHASMWAAKPSINYLFPQSLNLINFVYQLRKNHGPIAFFTMDAGPNTKIISEERHAQLIRESLVSSGLIKNIKTLLPGPGALLLESPS